MEMTNTGVGLSVDSALIARKDSAQKLGLFDVFTVNCYDSEGNLKWTDEVHNAITNEGIQYAIDALFYGGTQYTENTDWYVGIVDASPTDPTYTDTGASLPSIMGVTEFTEYSETNRQLLNLDVRGSASGGTLSVNNSGAVASFTITSGGSASVGGCFICAGGTASTIGGTATILYGAGAFSGGNKPVTANDTLNVTVTVSATSA